MKTKKEKIINIAKTEIGQRFIKMVNKISKDISDSEVDKLISDNNMIGECIEYASGVNNNFSEKIDAICEKYIIKRQKTYIDYFIKEEYNKILDNYNDNKFNKKEMKYQMNIVFAIAKVYEHITNIKK